jgi:hypothetical protein
MRIFLATKAFFQILFNRQIAVNYLRILDQTADQPVAASPSNSKDKEIAPRPVAAPSKPSRSDAISLLAALQREARLIDMIQEPLSDYSDEQVGVAARDVLRDAAKVIERMFAIKPLSDEQEGSQISTPAEFDAGRFHLTGNVAGTAPYQGRLVHPGWEATKCEIPQWNGARQNANIIAPIELELS